MSAYTVLQTRIVSAEHLVAALADLGFTRVEVHERPRPLVGWLGDARERTAEIIIRREHVGESSNDIGFARTADGSFEALVSEFDRQRFGAHWLGRLTQRYAYHVARDRLEAQGFDLVEEHAGQDQVIRLTLRRSA